MSASNGRRRILGMTCGQLVLLIILALVSCAAVSGGVYWVLTNPSLTGGPAVPTAFQISSPEPPTRTPGPVVLPPTWTFTPTQTATETPMPTRTPTFTWTPAPPTETTTATPGT